MPAIAAMTTASDKYRETEDGEGGLGKLAAFDVTTFIFSPQDLGRG